MSVAGRSPLRLVQSDAGCGDDCAPRKRANCVTHVSGMNCHPPLRKGSPQMRTPEDGLADGNDLLFAHTRFPNRTRALSTGQPHNWLW